MDKVKSVNRYIYVLHIQSVSNLILIFCSLFFELFIVYIIFICSYLANKVKVNSTNKGKVNSTNKGKVNRTNKGKVTAQTKVR